MVLISLFMLNFNFNMLIVRASGHPRPTITWRREDGKPHKLSLSTDLHFNDVKNFTLTDSNMVKEASPTFTMYRFTFSDTIFHFLGPTFIFKDIHTEKGRC